VQYSTVQYSTVQYNTVQSKAEKLNVQLNYFGTLMYQFCIPKTPIKVFRRKLGDRNLYQSSGICKLPYRTCCVVCVEQNVIQSLTHSLTHSRQRHYVYGDVWMHRDTRFSNCQSTNRLVRVSRSRMVQRVRWAYAAQCNETAVDIMYIEMTLNVFYSPARDKIAPTFSTRQWL